MVDSSVHGHKPLQAGFVLHVGVVEARVEHDDGEGQDVACVCQHKHNRERRTFSLPRAVTTTTTHVDCER